MKWISYCPRYVVGVFLTWSSMVCAAPTLDLYLPEAVPMTTVNQGDRHGIAGDLALQAMTLAGYTANVLSAPWPRAQREVATGKDMIITPLTRTQNREEHFTWIAPLVKMDRAFFSLDRHVESFEEARQAFKLIAVGIGTAQETRLREEGFPASQIYPLRIGENPAQMLLKGRVDAWFNGVPQTRYIWKQLSDRPLVMSRVLMSADLYLACSRDCDPRIVDNLRTAVGTLLAGGNVNQLQEAYLEGLPNW